MVNVGRRVRDITITANPSVDGWSGRNAQPTENEFSDRLLRGNDVIKNMRGCNDDTYKPPDTSIQATKLPVQGGRVELNSKRIRISAFPDDVDRNLHPKSIVI